MESAARKISKFEASPKCVPVKFGRPLSVTEYSQLIRKRCRFIHTDTMIECRLVFPTMLHGLCSRTGLDWFGWEQHEVLVSTIHRRQYQPSLEKSMTDPVCRALTFYRSLKPMMEEFGPVQ